MATVIDGFRSKSVSESEAINFLMCGMGFLNSMDFVTLSFDADGRLSL
jgi:hypothetical protein